MNDIPDLDPAKPNLENRSVILKLAIAYVDSLRAFGKLLERCENLDHVVAADNLEGHIKFRSVND
jgi:hypothetical protein